MGKRRRKKLNEVICTFMNILISRSQYFAGHSWITCWIINISRQKPVCISQLLQTEHSQNTVGDCKIFGFTDIILSVFIVRRLREVSTRDMSVVPFRFHARADSVTTVALSNPSIHQYEIKKHPICPISSLLSHHCINDYLLSVWFC